MRRFFPVFFFILLLLNLELQVNTRKGAVAVSDLTPPTSTLTLAPSSPDGLNGWYVSPVDNTISADDLESGVQNINWTHNGTSYSENFTNTLNLVQNPSFEDTGSPISLWDTVNPDIYATYSQDPTAAPSLGSYSAKVVATQGSWHAFSNRSNFSVASPLQNMTASAWVKTESVTGNANFRIYLIYDNGAGSSGTSLVSTSTSVTGTTGWQKISLNFIPNHSDTIGVYMELGIEGSGTVWFDGASIASSITQTATNFVISANGTHNLSYYSQDFAGNSETSNSTSYKIDTKAPSKWTNFTLTQSGNIHTFIISIKVSDITSGLDVSTAEFQYSVDQGVTWGYYETLTSCNSSFIQGWRSASTSPNSDGSTTVTITTPAVDFCNSNWASTKKIRFRITDMAGNESQSSDFSINGAWVQITNGSIYSNEDISMQNSTVSDLAGAQGTLSGITSTAARYVDGYSSLPFNNYDEWYAKNPTTTSLPSGRLPTTNGKYFVNNDFTIASSTIPSGLSSTQNLSAVVFINGDLNINSNYSFHATSGIIFIVNGDITIGSSVSSIHGFFISDGLFDVGSGSTALTINGGVQADSFNLRRSLNGNQNSSNPAETFTYLYKYLAIGKTVLTGNYSITWLEVN